MNKIDIVKKAFNFDSPPEVQREYLTDDFQYTNSVGEPPMDIEAWLGMGEIMRASIPDAGFAIDDIRQEGEDVILVGRFTGTFKHDFDLSAMNMGVIPATGKALNFPAATSRISFDGDKISRNHNLDTGPNAGMAGFLAVFKAS
jgi:predicted ester cyclase